VGDHRWWLGDRPLSPAHVLVCRNFAFLMAADIRERVSELPWVERVDVQLQDHFFDEEISGGVNCGKTFVETFPSLATDDLDELRATFRVKAFVARQERLIRSLLALGWMENAILELRIGDLPRLPSAARERPWPTAIWPS